MNKTITALKGVKVGHATITDKLTGCTLISFDEPLTVAYKGDGGAIGSFNTQGLLSGKTNYKEWGIFISGGSTTGLITGAEFIDLLRKDKKGSRIGDVYNPSVSGAIVFDQGMRIAPFESEYARIAYNNLSSDPVACGNVGAGTGTSVGKFQYVEGGTKSGAMKAGVGNARIDLGNGIIVTALSVVNAIGNVVDPRGQIIAGNRDEFTVFKEYASLQNFVTQDQANTTISVIGINVDLGSKEHYERVAHIATHGQIRAIYPVHTSSDGDSVFVFSTNEIKKPLNKKGAWFSETQDTIHFEVDIIGNAAAEAVQASIYDACKQAETVSFDGAWNGVIPSCKDYPIKKEKEE